LASEFEKYVSTGKVRGPALQSAFNMTGRLMREDLKMKNLPTASRAATSIFEQLLGQPNSALSAVPFNPDEWRILSAARYMMGASEDAAHKTHYFSRSRNLLERSVNHPYLGYYPASYMWGKVVPELVNFLIREPFGVRAPMWGYTMAGHVSQAIQMQFATDPDFRDWVEKHPEMIRFVMMMLPGTPWDIPVNMPAWMRHVAEAEAQNTIRTARGEAPQHADVLHEVADTASYAFGIGRTLETIGKIGKELNPKPEEQASSGPDLLARRRAMMTVQDQDVADASAELAPLLQ
jgi:hypothetical protein